MTPQAVELLPDPPVPDVPDLSKSLLWMLRINAKREAKND